MTMQLSSITFSLPKKVNSYLRSRIPLKISKKFMKSIEISNFSYEQKSIQGCGNVVYFTISNLPNSTCINELYYYVLNIIEKFLSLKSMFHNENLSDIFTIQDFQNSKYKKITFDFSIPMNNAVSLSDDIFINQRAVYIPYKFTMDEAHNMCADTEDEAVKINICPNETGFVFSIEYNRIKNKISYDFYRNLSKHYITDLLDGLCSSFRIKNEKLSNKIMALKELIKDIDN